MASYLYLNTPDQRWELAAEENPEALRARISSQMLSSASTVSEPVLQISVTIAGSAATLFLRERSIASFAVVEQPDIPPATAHTSGTEVAAHRI